MEKKVIMLACAAGMSTSLLVSKMQKAATEKGFDAEFLQWQQRRLRIM